MKSNKKKIGLIIVLVAVLLAIILGYTFSKYAQSVSIQTSSSVAKWQFAGEIKDSKYSSEDTTISLADTVDSDTVADGKIAPGTSGEFEIIIDATGSEVDIDYTIELTEETDKPTNLYFKCDEVQYSSLSELISSIESGTISKNDTDQTVTYTVSWEWPYETYVDDVLQDDVDLVDGQSITDYIFAIKITGTQKS